MTCLANNCCIRDTFERMRANYGQLRKRQFYLHHYQEYMDLGIMDEAAEKVDGLISDYATVEASCEAARANFTSINAQRMRPV